MLLPTMCLLQSSWLHWTRVPMRRLCPSPYRTRRGALRTNLHPKQRRTWGRTRVPRPARYRGGLLRQLENLLDLLRVDAHKFVRRVREPEPLWRTALHHGLHRQPVHRPPVGASGLSRRLKLCTAREELQPDWRHLVESWGSPRLSPARGGARATLYARDADPPRRVRWLYNPLGAGDAGRGTGEGCFLAIPLGGGRGR